MDDDRKVWLPSNGNGGSHPNWLALVKVSELRKALAEIDGQTFNRDDFSKDRPGTPQARLQSPSLEELGARVIDAGCKLISADINVYPMMSRADAVNAAYWELDAAVNAYRGAMPAMASSTAQD